MSLNEISIDEIEEWDVRFAVPVMAHTMTNQSVFNRHYLPLRYSVTLHQRRWGSRKFRYNIQSNIEV